MRTTSIVAYWLCIAALVATVGWFMLLVATPPPSPPVSPTWAVSLP